MNRRNGWLFTVGSLVLAAAAQAAPFAMVTELKGDAAAIEAGKPRKVMLLGYIDAPTELKVEGAAKVGITYFANGTQYSFEGPGRALLETQGPKVLEGKPVEARKVGPEKAIGGGTLSNDQWRRLQQATVVMRTVKAGFSIVGPDKTALLSLEPEFEWTPVADAKRYRVVVYGPQNQIVHEATTEQTVLRAGGAITLEAGRQYRWKVDALGVAKPVSATGSFTAADESVRKRFTASRPDAGAGLPARIFYATSLEAEGHGHDARAEWKALARQYPDVAEFKQRSQ
jgi:hypothetical protein